jgi:hypothetical protein
MGDLSHVPAAYQGESSLHFRSNVKTLRVWNHERSGRELDHNSHHKAQVRSCCLTTYRTAGTCARCRRSLETAGCNSTSFAVRHNKLARLRWAGSETRRYRVVLGPQYPSKGHPRFPFAYVGHVRDKLPRSRTSSWNEWSPFACELPGFPSMPSSEHLALNTHSFLNDVNNSNEQNGLPIRSKEHPKRPWICSGCPSLLPRAIPTQ